MENLGYRELPQPIRSLQKKHTTGKYVLGSFCVFLVIFKIWRKFHSCFTSDKSIFLKSNFSIVLHPRHLPRRPSPDFIYGYKVQCWMLVCIFFGEAFPDNIGLLLTLCFHICLSTCPPAVTLLVPFVIYKVLFIFSMNVTFGKALSYDIQTLWPWPCVTHMGEGQGHSQTHLHTCCIRSST